MRIALLATTHKPISEESNGGSEVFVYNLAKELQAQGHEPVVFGLSESSVPGELASNDFVQWRDRDPMDYFWPSQLASLAQAHERILAGEFDIIHNNLFETFGALFLSQSKPTRTVFLSTLHNYFFTQPRLRQIFRQFSSLPYVFASESARTLAQLKDDFPQSFVIPHGISIEQFSFCAQNTGEYVLWLGRTYPLKGAHDAIAAARRAGIRLIIAGTPTSPKEEQYFHEEIEPYIDGHTVEFIRDPSLQQKIVLYQHALALLTPSHMDEPNSLVSLESLSTGTPVIGYRRGALPELIQDGATGILVEEHDIEGLAAAIYRAGSLHRLTCRRAAEERFSSARMANDYVKLYEALRDK